MSQADFFGFCFVVFLHQIWLATRVHSKNWIVCSFSSSTESWHAKSTEFVYLQTENRLKAAKSCIHHCLSLPLILNVMPVWHAHCRVPIQRRTRHTQWTLCVPEDSFNTHATENNNYCGSFTGSMSTLSIRLRLFAYWTPYHIWVFYVSITYYFLLGFCVCRMLEPIVRMRFGIQANFINDWISVVTSSIHKNNQSQREMKSNVRHAEAFLMQQLFFYLVLMLVGFCFCVLSCFHDCSELQWNTY